MLWHNSGPAIFGSLRCELKEHYKVSSKPNDVWLEFSPDESEILVYARTSENDKEGYFIRIDRATGKRISSTRTGAYDSGKMLVLPDGQHMGLLYNAGNLNIFLQIRRISTGELKGCYHAKGFAGATDGLFLNGGRQFLLGHEIHDLP